MPRLRPDGIMTLLTGDQRRDLLRVYGKRYGLRTFIETGTADGETPMALLQDFTWIHTIEADPDKFSRSSDLLAPYKHVICWYGDSGTVLADALDLGDDGEPALVWLDSHWCQAGHHPSGPEYDTPVRQELAALWADGRPHVILIDDARLMREGDDWETEQYDWPALSWVRAQAEAHGYTYTLEDDVIRLVPTSRCGECGPKPHRGGYGFCECECHDQGGRDSGESE